MRTYWLVVQETWMDNSHTDVHQIDLYRLNMAPFTIYDLVIQYEGKIYNRRNVDPDKYSRLNLLTDVCEKALADMPSTLGVVIKLYYELGSMRFEVTNDEDVLEMFEICGNSEINIFVEVEQWSSQASQVGPSQVTEGGGNEEWNEHVGSEDEIYEDSEDESYEPFGDGVDSDNNIGYT